MVKKKIASCNKCPGVISHILAVAGFYVLAGGLINNLGYAEVLTSAIFWGLILIGMANCIMHKTSMMCSIK